MLFLISTSPISLPLPFLDLPHRRRNNAGDLDFRPPPALILGNSHFW
jgi:hypothetical protein